MTATVRVTVRLDHSRINPMLVDASDASAQRAAYRTRDRARANAPVATGRLRRSITAHREHRGVNSSWVVSASAPYAIYQEKGTGPIVAGPGRVLRFRPKGSNTFIFRPRTSGVPATHFMRDAYRALRFSDYLP